jgi:hypothetical protein
MIFNCIYELYFYKVFFVSDYVEFTNSSKYATDGCLLDNTFSSQQGLNIEADTQIFEQGLQHRLTDKSLGKFWLLSMAGGQPGDAITLKSKVQLEPKWHSGLNNIAECASQYNIPNMTAWCPATLLDDGQLADFYKQQSLQNGI